MYDEVPLNPRDVANSPGSPAVGHEEDTHATLPLFRPDESAKTVEPDDSSRCIHRTLPDGGVGGLANAQPANKKPIASEANLRTDCFFRYMRAGLKNINLASRAKGVGKISRAGVGKSFISSALNALFPRYYLSADADQEHVERHRRGFARRARLHYC